MNQSAIVKPYVEKKLQQGDFFYCYDAGRVNNFDENMFNADYWQKKNAITGSAQGRGTTWFIQHNNQAWVLRHYYRGGLIGKLIQDKYLYLGEHNTRAAREYHLLNTLQRLNLPAPKPVAYRVIKQGFRYQADLLSTRIEGAQDLVAILSNKALPDEVFENIGAVIKAFHNAGIYHHDLNIHNILLDDKNKVWLIDFDRGEQRTISPKWQQANLARLQRSFLKEQSKLPEFNWQQNQWQILLEGYLSH